MLYWNARTMQAMGLCRPSGRGKRIDNGRFKNQTGNARLLNMPGRRDQMLRTMLLCALTAAIFFLPFYIIDGGFSTMRAISTASRSASTAT